MKLQRPTGFAAFVIVWLGQVISLMGSAMSGFALTIWAWQFTGSATALALMGFFAFGPTVLFSPIAGALVDRWNKKLVMALSDIAAGTTTIAILILYATGNLQIWHMYVAGAISGLFQAFQWPAYSAAISVMVPKEQYARSAGMMSLAEWGSGIFAPVLAGTFIGLIGISSILIIDIVTFVLAVLALIIIKLPPIPVSEEGKKSRGNIWQESLYGFRYILARPALLGLQMIFFFGNLMATISGTLSTPMILARTGDNAQILGLVQTLGSAGGIAGSLIISAWGGPKRRIHGVVFGWLLSGLLGQFLFGFNFGIPGWLIANFFCLFFGPIINSSNQAIWQSKVPPDLQGRVFSVRRMIAQITAPVAMLVAGPLADRVFEPAMRVDTSALSRIFGGITGVGPGAGMAAIMSISGVMIVFISFFLYINPMIRNVETSLPDHDMIPQTAD
ncbi:MAG: MFS transporter [Anaerolineae bacterium]|nr:MFS transporter [Anaerolineae bacterium]